MNIKKYNTCRQKQQLSRISNEFLPKNLFPSLEPESLHTKLLEHCEIATFKDRRRLLPLPHHHHLLSATEPLRPFTPNLNWGPSSIFLFARSFGWVYLLPGQLVSRTPCQPKKSHSVPRPRPERLRARASHSMNLECFLCPPENVHILTSNLVDCRWFQNLNLNLAYTKIVYAALKGNSRDESRRCYIILVILCSNCPQPILLSGCGFLNVSTTLPVAHNSFDQQRSGIYETRRYCVCAAKRCPFLSGLIYRFAVNMDVSFSIITYPPRSTRIKYALTIRKTVMNIPV